MPKRTERKSPSYYVFEPIDADYIRGLEGIWKERYYRLLRIEHQRRGKATNMQRAEKAFNILKRWKETGEI